MLRRTAVGAVALALAFAGAAIAVPASQRQAPPGVDSVRAQWLDAEDAWTSGRYPEALRGLIALAEGPSGDTFHDRIALLTGELFATAEVTADGRNPRVSSTGRWVAYDVPSQGDVRTRVADTWNEMRVVADLAAEAAIFDPTGGRIAWLRPDKTGTPGSSEILVRDLASGAERVAVPPGLLKTSLAWSGADVAFVGGAPGDPTQSNIYLAPAGQPAWPITDTIGHKTNLIASSDGRVLIYTRSTTSPFGNASGPPPQTADVVVLDRTTRTSRVIADIAAGTLTVAADGGTIAWISRAADGAVTLFRSPTLDDRVEAIASAAGAQQLTAPALSPSGRLAAYQVFDPVGSSTSWDIHVAEGAATRRRLTEDIQHDVLPRFLDDQRLIGLIGEPRHRRAHVYDLATGTRTRLFANNTVRTISPEYAWVPNADGTRLVVNADRDGDTVSSARGIYLVDLTRRVTRGELVSRLKAQLDAEVRLRERMIRAYRPIADDVEHTVGRVSPNRIYDCARALGSFGSKHVTQPGNGKAIEYLEAAYRASGYTPELQWVETTVSGPSGRTSVKTANVVATLRGSVTPDLIYVISSHFDSVTVSPGADDNTSGTCALLETARVLAAVPQPATIVLASFTGEESGLVGSREFVRLAAGRGWQIAGALNNDMIGWSGDGARLDNTIRYSNDGIRDLQHGAAFLFTDLVLFDARYFLGTDAAAFNEAWGDIVGGLGSYPILANPNYHRRTDLTETIDVRQVAESAKVTAATAMALASSPERLRQLSAQRQGRAVEVTWAPAREADVRGYLVAYGRPGQPETGRLSVRAPRASIPDLAAGTEVRVAAVNARGLESWDWAKVTVN